MSRLRNLAWDVFGVNFWSGDFLGVLLEALRIFGGFDFCPHSIIPVTWNPEYPQPWGKGQLRPQGFSLKKWVGREKALASAGHVYSLNIPAKLIYMQHAGFALTERSTVTMENNNIANYVNILVCVRFKSLRSI